MIATILTALTIVADSGASQAGSTAAIWRGKAGRHLQVEGEPADRLPRAEKGHGGNEAPDGAADDARPSPDGCSQEHAKRLPASEPLAPGRHASWRLGSQLVAHDQDHEPSAMLYAPNLFEK